MNVGGASCASTQPNILTLVRPSARAESFVERRSSLVRRAARSLLFRPALPLALIENGEGCKLNEQRQRTLPDGTAWLVHLLEQLVEQATARPAYQYKKRYTRNPNNSLKWLLPVLAYGQYWLWNKFIVPELRKDEALVAADDERVWRVKARRRRELGIGPPLQPTKENAWRLEQMYDDD